MLHHTAATRWDTGKLLRIIRSMSVGVNYLHTTQPAVLHRDLKPGNIFVDTGQVGLELRRAGYRVFHTRSKPVLQQTARTQPPL